MQFKDAVTFSYLDRRWSCDVTMDVGSLPSSFRGMAIQIASGVLNHNVCLPPEMAVNYGLVPPPKAPPNSSTTFVVKNHNRTYRWAVVAIVVGAAALFTTFLLGG